VAVGVADIAGAPAKIRDSEMFGPDSPTVESTLSLLEVPGLGQLLVSRT